MEKYMYPAVVELGGYMMSRQGHPSALRVNTRNSTDEKNA